MKNINWKKYAFESLSIFIAVISAFALSNWSNKRNNNESEQKILIEIKNGIEKDTEDFNGNVTNHKYSLRANKVFRSLMRNQPISQDSIAFFYVALFRDYTALINRSGYESLKAAGLKTIKNDSLRLQIITLYDYYYGIVEVLDTNSELQSFVNYFASVNELLHPYMEFNKEGTLIRIADPKELNQIQRKEILSFLWRLEINRNYKLARYHLILQTMEKVKENIKLELEQ
jgi:hypothetical protein